MPGSVLQRLHIPVSTRAIDRNNLTVDIVASTPSVDSYGTIIDQNGWDLDQFKRNPVITWAHDDRGFTGSDGLPIANAIPDSVRVENGQLKMRLRFTPEDVNPFGYKVFRMIADGFIHGVSVGFDPQEDESQQSEDGETVRVYTRCKLLETAVVTIPSNDDALIQRQARNLNRENDIETIRSQAKEIEEMAEAKSKDPQGKVKKDDRDYQAYVEKCIGYFEKKQKPNRAATRFLKHWYQVRAEEPPEDEADAWDEMGEHLDQMKTHIDDVQSKLDDCYGRISEMEKTLASRDDHNNVQNSDQEDNVEDARDAHNNVQNSGHDNNVEDARSTPPSKSVSAEAPQTARKASVQIPMGLLPLLPDIMDEAKRKIAEEALRRGFPKDKLGVLLDSMKPQIKESVINSISHT